MAWCVKCGVSSDKENLFDAISDEGIIRVCQNCASDERWPIIKRPSDSVPKKISAPPLPKNMSVKMSRDSKSMLDRLTRISGVVITEKKQENPELIKENQVLKEIASKNFESKLSQERGNDSELIDNFNWAIMRTRRAKHLSHQQLAEAIGEPEIAIRKAEQGIIPGGVSFIRKIESYLGIHLFKIKQDKSELGFDPITTRNMTISDLRKMKEERTELFRGNMSPDDFSIEDIGDKRQEKMELSDEEVDDILFGR